MLGIDARTRLMLALDVPTTDAAHELLNRVGDHIHIIKIGLELFTSEAEIGANERIDHLDQRGGPDNGVELIKHQCFERVKGLAQEPFGARQPEVSFSVMGPLLPQPRLVAEMLMVPSQHEKV